MEIKVKTITTTKSSSIPLKSIDVSLGRDAIGIHRRNGQLERGKCVTGIQMRIR